jgi:methanogenic corrinoid protein MtbC1
MTPTAPTFDREQHYQDYLQALLAGDRRACQASFETWLIALPELRSVYEELIQRSLYDVGSLWEQGRVSVATEHLATAISESLLNLVYPRLFQNPRTGKSAVVTCGANETHQIGGKMVADLFELNGWRGYFLGANTPIRDLLGLVQEKRPDVVTFSVTIFFNLEACLAGVAAVRGAFPELPILVGGQALRWGGHSRFQGFPGVLTLASLAELEAWMHTQVPHAC